MKCRGFNPKFTTANFNTDLAFDRLPHDLCIFCICHDQMKAYLTPYKKPKNAAKNSLLLKTLVTSSHIVLNYPQGGPKAANFHWQAKSEN